VEAQDVEALLKAWETDANWMKKQPGFISTQLHRAIGESHVFMNYAVWQSVEDFRNAFTHPDFQKAIGHYPTALLPRRTCSRSSLFPTSAWREDCTTSAAMEYGILKFVHVLGAVLMGGGLIGVWIADLRSRQLSELKPLSEAVRCVNTTVATC
jgi:quinol monooxygenase YgiN